MIPKLFYRYRLHSVLIISCTFKTSNAYCGNSKDDLVEFFTKGRVALHEQ